MGGGNLVFADANGEIAKAEVGFRNLEVQHQDAGFVACANHFEAPSTRATYRRKSDDSERDSRWRLATVNRELSRMEETLDSHAAMRLMSLHGERYSICRHGSPGQATGTATISSVLFIPERHGFYCCQGFPCTMPFDWIGF